MFRKLYLSVWVIVLLLAAPANSFAAAPTAAEIAANAKPNIQQGLCSGVNNLNVSNSSCSNTLNEAQLQKQINDFIKTVIDLLSGFVGIIAVIMVMFGGFKYITSGGNDSNVSGAKNTILYAVIGLVVVSLAQVIVKFVLAKATSV